MSRLSNKGQSLTLFVVFIPLIIMLGCLVIDLGFAKYNKNKLNELTKMVTSYGVKHIDEEPYNEMVDLLYQNDDSIDNYKIEVKPDEKIVSVSVDKATKGFFGKIINKEMYKEKSSYVGKIENEKIIIEEGAK